MESTRFSRVRSLALVLAFLASLPSCFQSPKLLLDFGDADFSSALDSDSGDAGPDLALTDSAPDGSGISDLVQAGDSDSPDLADLGEVTDSTEITDPADVADALPEVCAADCAGKQCGSDGCDGSCGECAPSTVCEATWCVPNLTWISIPAGTFKMGCSSKDNNCSNDEKPAHDVMMAMFEILETEVTEAQYQAAMIGLAASPTPSANLNGGGGPESPVENVTWDDARAFCEAMGGRLPTEAEWEYAARGGTAMVYSCGNSQNCLSSIAWFESNADSHKHGVKTKGQNEYGLYDMSGNVAEWVEDLYHDTYIDAPEIGYPAWTEPGDSNRVVRGGSFTEQHDRLRISNRSDQNPTDGHSGTLGFRCARSL